MIDPSAPPPRRLSDSLAGLGRVVVAFSGVVDSSVLAHAALRELVVVACCTAASATAICGVEVGVLAQPPRAAISARASAW